MKLTDHWGGKYVIAIETTIILSMLGFYFTGYKDLVTKDDLQSLAPYTKDEASITSHMQETVGALKEVRVSLNLLNEKMTQELHQMDLRVTILEEKVKR